jgi:hypothetical protein
VAARRTNRQVIGLSRAKRFLDQADHLSGATSVDLTWLQARLLLRRSAAGVEVDCLTLLAGEATVDSVPFHDSRKVLGKATGRILEAGIVDRDNAADGGIVDQVLQCLGYNKALRVRLISVGERTVCGKENFHRYSPENA